MIPYRHVLADLNFWYGEIARLEQELEHAHRKARELECYDDAKADKAFDDAKRERENREDPKC